MTRTWTVLIVDDDGDYRALLRRYLDRGGHRVLEAGTGREGMKLATQPGVDAIVIDGLLPDTDGLRWLADLRGRGIRTPAVFASSFFKDIETHRRLTRDMGVAAVLQKPVTDLKPFVAEVEAALMVAMGQAPAARRDSPGPRTSPIPPVARGSTYDRPLVSPPPPNAPRPPARPAEPAGAPAPPRYPQDIADAIDEILAEKPKK
jgi:CheY-like chemotaxis protein